MHKVISDIVVVNDFSKKELTAGFYCKLVYTDFVVLFTQCSPYSLGGRLFLCLCELSRKNIVSKYISLKCSFEHSCSNWVDFVKSGCEKSWAEVQADSFSFECRGCMRMKELEVELE